MNTNERTKFAPTPVRGRTMKKAVLPISRSASRSVSPIRPNIKMNTFGLIGENKTNVRINKLNIPIESVFATKGKSNISQIHMKMKQKNNSNHSENPIARTNININNYNLNKSSDPMNPEQIVVNNARAKTYSVNRNKTFKRNNSGSSRILKTNYVNPITGGRTRRVKARGLTKYRRVYKHITY
jgi:hypothetical protein